MTMKASLTSIYIYIYIYMSRTYLINFGIGSCVVG
jgi:hypothetical protein